MLYSSMFWFYFISLLYFLIFLYWSLKGISIWVFHSRGFVNGILTKNLFSDFWCFNQKCIWVYMLIFCIKLYHCTYMFFWIVYLNSYFISFSLVKLLFFLTKFHRLRFYFQCWIVQTIKVLYVSFCILGENI